MAVHAGSNPAKADTSQAWRTDTGADTKAKPLKAFEDGKCFCNFAGLRSCLRIASSRDHASAEQKGISRSKP